MRSCIAGPERDRLWVVPGMGHVGARLLIPSIWQDQIIRRADSPVVLPNILFNGRHP